MTVDDFVRAIENLAIGLNGPDGPTDYAARRMLDWMSNELNDFSTTEASKRLDFQIEEEGLFAILAPAYVLYQNYGVAGKLGNIKGAIEDEFNNDHIHSFGINSGMNVPPTSAFERYGSDKFKVKWAVYKYGVTPKKWFTMETLMAKFNEYLTEYGTEVVAKGLQIR
jgi:hypothetical protein